MTNLKLIRPFLFACVFCSVSDVNAGLEPENVAVVINADDADSKTIAREFIRLREIPEANVIELTNIPVESTSDIAAFRTRILTPLLNELDERGINQQISCIAYSSGFPTAFRLKDLPDQPRPKYMTPVGSLTGLTLLYEQVQEEETDDYLSLTANQIYRQPVGTVDTSKLAPADAAEIDRARQLIRDGKQSEGREILKEVTKRLPKPVLSGVQPTLRINPEDRWAKGGQLSIIGRRYLLSTMLSVTAKNGLSVEESVSLLRRSHAADATRPAGTIFYMVNSNIRSRTRQPLFELAIEQLNERGVAAEATDGILPKERDDIAGLMAGSAKFDWLKSASKMKPGAIAEHLTSFGGIFGREHGQSSMAEFLRNGAAGSSGTVTEPYAIPYKFPNAFLHVHYTAGCTLAEAFAQSVYGPYQLLIVGDPLCRPWSQKVSLEVELQNSTTDDLFEFTWKASDLPEIPSEVEAYVDGKLYDRIAWEETLTLDSESIEKGDHRLTIIAEFPTHIDVDARGTMDFSRSVAAE